MGYTRDRPSSFFPELDILKVFVRVGRTGIKQIEFHQVHRQIKTKYKLCTTNIQEIGFSISKAYLINY